MLNHCSTTTVAEKKAKNIECARKSSKIPLDKKSIIIVPINEEVPRIDHQVNNDLHNVLLLVPADHY